MKSAYHKKLLHQLTEARRKLVEKQGVQRMIETDVRKLAHEVFDLETELKKEAQKEITVSEHAMLRYFQRVEGYDIEHVSKLILPDDVREEIEKLGDGHYPVPKMGEAEFTIVVRARTVVTVEIKDEA